MNRSRLFVHALLLPLLLNVYISAAAPPAGSRDLTFIPEFDSFDSYPSTVFVQADGKILIRATIHLDYQGYAGLTRINPDGSIDQSFKNGIRASDDITLLAQQPDGWLIIGGYFNAVDDTVTHALVRLRTDGTVDPSFHPALPTNTWPDALAIDASSRILVQAHSEHWEQISLFRLLQDGSIDPAFRVFTTDQSSAILVNGLLVTAVTYSNLISLDDSGQPLSITTLPPQLTTKDGCILTQGGGSNLFVNTFSLPADALVRLNADGAYDPSFFPPAFGTIYNVHVQPNGKVIVVDGFRNDDDLYTIRVRRLFPDGSIDSTYVGDPPLGFGGSALDPRDRLIGLGVSDYWSRGLYALNGDNAPELPLLQWTVTNVTVLETNGVATLSLQRSGSTLGAAVIHFVTTPVTAQSGIDFMSATGTCRFSAGETQQTLAVPILDNDHIDLPRTFQVSITSLQGAVLAGSSNIAVTIADDEIPNRLQFLATSFPVKENQGHALITVVRDLGSTGAVSVRYRLDNGTAKPGRDYGNVHGVLAFAPGQFTNTFEVPIIDTRKADGNRVATLQLYSPEGGAKLGVRSAATLVIFDDESPAIITTLADSWLRAAALGGGAIRFAANGNLQLLSPIDLDANTSLDGADYNVILTASPNSHHLSVSSNAAVTIKGLTFIDGLSTNGGSIYNEGVLSIQHCTFSNNLALGKSGVAGDVGTNGPSYSPGIDMSAGPGGDGTSGFAAAGGAISSSGPLRIDDSLFLNNSARGGDGGPGGDGGNAREFARPGAGGNGGSAGAARGGAIYSHAPLHISRSLFTLNSAAGGVAGTGGVPGTNDGRSYATRVWGSAGFAAEAAGGAVFANDQLSLQACRFDGNACNGGAGNDGIFPYNYSARSATGANGGSGRDGGSASGGACLAAASLFCSNNVWTSNHAIAGNGGRGGEGGNGISMFGLRQLGGNGGYAGSGADAIGGALCAVGPLVAVYDDFAGNAAIAGSAATGGSGGYGTGSYGGSVASAGTGGHGGHASGGALAAHADVQLTRVAIHNNAAIAGHGGTGGAPGVHDPNISVIFGAAGLSGAAGQSDGGGLYASGRISLFACTLLTNTAAAGNGGPGWNGAQTRGKYNLPNGGVGTRGGDSSGGGALLIGSSRLDRCVFVGNEAIAGRGAAGGDGGYSGFASSRGAPGSPGGDVFGAGLCHRGELVIVNTTVALNHAVPGPGGNGGTGDPSPYSGPLIDPTARGASAGGGFGSGIAVGSNSIVLYCTIASNSILTATGGIGGVSAGYSTFSAASGSNSVPLGSAIYSASQVQISGTILAGANESPLVAGAVADAGFNLCADTSLPISTTSTRIATDLLLAPLADNGGDTLTMALLPGSPAIDAAPDPNAPATDQRGFARPFGSAADIGAFEFTSPTAAPSSTAPDARFLVARSSSADGLLHCRINTSATAQGPCVLECSTNLFDWTEIKSIAPTNTPLEISLPITRSTSHQFFRLRPTP